MCDRPEYVRIKSRIARDLLGVHLVALPVAVRERPKLAHVGHDHLMDKFLDLLADPDRMGSGFHGNSNSSEIPKALVYSGRVGSEAASVYDLALFVERAVMAPDVPKVDPIVIPTLELLRGFEMKCCG
jgi:hypothetical protein